MRENWNNTKEYSVQIKASVSKNKTIREAVEDFGLPLIVHVKSPKSNTWLRDVRLDYLKGPIYNFLVSKSVDGTETMMKIVAALECPQQSIPGRYSNYLETTVQLTAHDLWCCMLADNGWVARQEDYAD